jgi:hypothetical protein
VLTPGQSNYSLLWERVITNSGELHIFVDEITYLDEEAAANNYDPAETNNEYRATIYLQIVSSSGANADYDVCLGYVQ